MQYVLCLNSFTETAQTVCGSERKGGIIQGVFQERIRTVRVAARRQRALMCIIRYQETEEQEWHNEEEVQHTGRLVDNIAQTSGTPVLLVTGRYIPWIDA